MENSKNKSLPPLSFLSSPNWDNQNNNNTSNNNSNNNHNGGRSIDKLLDQLPSSSNNSPEFLNHNSNNNSNNNHNGHSYNNINSLINNSNGNNNNNNNNNYDRIMASSFDSIEIQRRYENQIENLMNQIQGYIEREQKQRNQVKSTEEINNKLENENIQLKKELFELSKRLKEVDNSNGSNNSNNVFSPPPLIKYGSNGNLNNSNNSINNNRKLIEQQQQQKRKIKSNDGDEEAALVAEALGSFGDYTKPSLKRSNSEEVITPSMYKNNNSNSMNNKINEIQNWQQQLQSQQQQQQNKNKKIKKEEDDNSNNKFNLNNSNNSISPPNNQFIQQQQQQPLNQKSKLNKSQSIYPSSLSQTIPEMETDVDSTDEFDFSRKDDDSPDSNENRNSSPIEMEPSFEASTLFKTITPGASSPQEELLNGIHQLQMQQRDSIEKIYIAQKQFLSDPGYNDEILHSLQNDQSKLAGQIESELQALNQLYSQTILEPNQLCKLDILLQDISIQLKQLHLYQMELNYGGNDPFPATLVIIKQPFPMVISKFKQLQEDHLCVQLLTGANVDIISHSPIKAELVFHSKNLTKGSNNLGSQNSSKKSIEKDSQLLDPVKGIAKFPIKFLTGTRKSCVKLHFVLQIKTSEGNIINVPSSTTQPFIVITNDCQWEGSEGTLLKKETFNEKFEITWPHFVNILQKHFLKATKQSPIQPTRPLSLYDFNYLNTTFFGGKNSVSHKDFDSFWAWFGKSIQTLRYKRHISTLWQNGLIFMFLKRESVNQILKNQEPGTFVILFSESFPGQLEISYVANNDTSNGLNKSTDTISNGPLPATRVKHYLVQANDTSGSKRTLPDFLNECPQFTHILQLNVQMIPQTDGVPIFKRELKNQVLEPYFSKRNANQNIIGSGYDPLY